jgi:N-acetylneuraminic acid mutarotase
VKVPRGGVPSEELAQIGCLLAFDPDHNLIVLPHKDRTWVFDTQKGGWAVKPTPDSPGKQYEYTRQVYVKSKKVFLTLARVEKEKGKPENRLFSYDPAANKWTDLNTQEMPPFRGSKFGLVYDSKNDVVLLLGGGVSWNEGWRNDLWVYHVGANRWEKLTPKVVGAKEGPKFLDNMPSAYDERHNAVIFTDGNVPWAYRYKR